MTFRCFISGSSSHWAGSGGAGLHWSQQPPNSDSSVNKEGSSPTLMGTCFCMSLTKRVGHHGLCDTWLSFQVLCPYFIFSKIILQKPNPLTMTNIWIKTKPDSFQGSWADQIYLEPAFSLSS